MASLAPSPLSRLYNSPRRASRVHSPVFGASGVLWPYDNDTDAHSVLAGPYYPAHVHDPRSQTLAPEDPIESVYVPFVTAAPVPVAPREPEAPSEPDAPSESVAPSEPATPSEPAAPNEPAVPSESVAPSEPVVPSEFDEPECDGDYEVDPDARILWDGDLASGIISADEVAGDEAVSRAIHAVHAARRRAATCGLSRTPNAKAQRVA